MGMTTNPAFAVSEAHIHFWGLLIAWPLLIIGVILVVAICWHSDRQEAREYHHHNKDGSR